ncbi:MAG: hypothetical protein LBH16_04450 [Treponema sp.]|jgi:inorganic pyrophosphatase|nr:hypothetical protein [Treponema sp.]
MNVTNCLEMLPLSSIAKYAKGQPGDSVPFTGFPRVHSSEKNKLILVNDPVGPNPKVLEFMLEDIMFVEEIPSAVTEAGEGVPLVKLWIRRGAVGVILEPFEVNDDAPFSENKNSAVNRQQAG